MDAKDKAWTLAHLARLTKKAQRIKVKAPSKKRRRKLVCKTRELKTRHLFAAHPQPAALFSGVIHFVSMTFRTSGGDYSVSGADLGVALAHAQASAPAISAYASQYGPTSVEVDSTILHSVADVPTGKFNDADVQGWVATIGQAAGIPPNDAIAILSPPKGVSNTDAPVSQGVLGYHGYGGGHPYLFVNVLGTGLTLADEADAYALALSHEIAELVVDPAADLSNPEVCDGCGPNCRIVFRDYFDATGQYLQTSTLFPLPSYGFFINAIVQPAHGSDCPPPDSACVYGPPGAGTPPPLPPHPCDAFFANALDELRHAQLFRAFRDAILGIECLLMHL